MALNSRIVRSRFSLSSSSYGPYRWRYIHQNKTTSSLTIAAPLSTIEAIDKLKASHEALRLRAEQAEAWVKTMVKQLDEADQEVLQAETQWTRATMYLYDNHTNAYRELEKHLSALEADHE